nr:hypothetical protein [Tanacetum cinerariifolium]
MSSDLPLYLWVVAPFLSTSNHPIIVPSDSDIEDAFSSTHSSNHTPASPDYFPASPGNNSPDPSDDLSKLRDEAIYSYLNLNFKSINYLIKVEPNQPDLAPAILKPALVNENEEPKKEEEFEEEKEFKEEEPQGEEEDMEVDIREE